jgi:inner membrane protein
VALVARYGARPGPAGFRGAALFCSIAANNMPDLDFLYSGVTEGKLGYLLHHRGHTHTLGGLLPMAVLALLPVVLWAWKRQPRWSPGEWRTLVALALLGPALHIGMDFLNNYGVHPFWPLGDHWVYGDAVFIVEPFFYLFIALVLAFECRTRAARWILRLAVGVVLTLAWALPYVAWAWALALTLLAGLVVLLAARLGRPARVGGATTLSLGVIALFFGASHSVEAQVRQRLGQLAPAATTHDVVLTPLPANPLCWNVLAVQTHGEDYVVRRGQAALLPGWLTARECPSPQGEGHRGASPQDPSQQERAPYEQAPHEQAPYARGTTAPLMRVPLEEDTGLVWSGQFSAPLSELQKLAASHCEVAAFLRFSRAPFFISSPASLIVGDMRYDRNEALDFAELELAWRPDVCPRAIPGWRPPLADLL